MTGIHLGAIGPTSDRYVLNIALKKRGGFPSSLRLSIRSRWGWICLPAGQLEVPRVLVMTRKRNVINGETT